jgi:hypothetical protein
MKSSLPGLTRQSIFFARISKSDTRVPATPRLRRAFQCQAGEALAKTASARMTQSMLQRRSQILIHRFKQPHFLDLAARCVRGLQNPSRDLREGMERREAPGCIGRVSMDGRLPPSFETPQARGSSG